MKLLVRSAAMVLVGMAAMAVSLTADAHPGGLNAHGCHLDRSTGERHWHVAKSRDVAGPCHKMGGAWQPKIAEKPEAAPPAPKPKPALVTVPSADYTALVAERDRLKSELSRSQALARDRGAKVRSLEARVGAAEAAARDARQSERAARQLAIEAQEDTKAAEARAKGHGPAVSPKCVRGVKRALDSGWRFSSDEKLDLRIACLE